MMSRMRPVTDKKLLLGCYEAPGFGGASTSAYELFRAMRADGIDLHFVNLIDERDRVFFEYTFGCRLGNPDGLPAVSNAFINESFFAPQPQLAQMIDRRAPDVMIGVGYVAAAVLKATAPECRLVYLTTGCRLAEEIVRGGDANAFRLLTGGPTPSRRLTYVDDQRRALSDADLVITHSGQTRDFLLRFYPEQSGKIYPRVIWFAEWIHAAARRDLPAPPRFAEREIDVLFIASSWDRRVKNYGLVRRVAEQLKSHSVHVVGDVEKPIVNVTHHGFLARRESVLALMGNTRVVASPSLVDSAPGVLFEASALGCNVVASKNVGNYRLCHPDLLVDPFTPEGFVERIALAAERPFADNIDEFVLSGSYADLIETLAVL